MRYLYLIVALSACISGVEDTAEVKENLCPFPLCESETCTTDAQCVFATGIYCSHSKAPLDGAKGACCDLAGAVHGSCATTLIQGNSCATAHECASNYCALMDGGSGICSHWPPPAHKSEL